MVFVESGRTVNSPGVFGDHFKSASSADRILAGSVYALGISYNSQWMAKTVGALPLVTE